MKTTFKRALSIVIAVCVLLASATCLIGISSFAETPDDNTVAYLWTFAQTDVTNYLQSNGASIKATGTGEHTVRYSFDYYVPSSTTGYFTARNSNKFFMGGAGAVNPYDGIVNESTTGSSFLAEGTIGHLDVTMKAKSGSARELYAGLAGETSSKVPSSNSISPQVVASEVPETPVTGTSLPLTQALGFQI